MCFYFPQVLPLGQFEGVPCSMCGIASPVQVSCCHLCREPPCLIQVLGFYNPSLPPEDLQVMNSQSPFLILLLLYYFPLEMTEHLEIPGKWWLHPQRAAQHHLCSQINVPKHVAFAVCCEYLRVLHQNCSAFKLEWFCTCRCVCIVVASSLLLGYINQPHLSVTALQSPFY